MSEAGRAHRAKARKKPLPLNEAIRLAYKGNGLTQAQIADAIGDGMTQAKFSKYARGETRPSLEMITQIEQASGRPMGWILNAAGYLDDAVSDVPGAIEMDPALSAEGRRILIRMYETLLDEGPNEP